MRRLLEVLFMVSAFFLLGACDLIAQKELKVGESSAEDVRKYMGKPEMIWEEKDGSQVLEYVRGPEGHQTYMVSIGTDGKYKGMKNILIPTEFAKVQTGMSRDDVRRLLGKPTEILNFKLKEEEVWSWRHIAEAQRSQMFNVHFSLDGKVKTTSNSPDPRTMNAGG